jgi:isopenicillin N synthase-like dioxygenase
MKSLFRMPKEKLLKLHVDNSQGVKGYLPFKFQDGNDSRAAYSLGRDYTNPEQHFVATAPPGTVSINQWPDEDLPEFRKIIYDYCEYHSGLEEVAIVCSKQSLTYPIDQDVFKFARKLLQIFALALGIEETDLDETFRYPLNDITMQYYPIQKSNTQSSITPHADYGGMYSILFSHLLTSLNLRTCTNSSVIKGFTLLYQDQVGGLEVLNANGNWIPAPPKEHAYVVNTGSYMEVLSNKRFTATVHRAFGNPLCERFSLPFFFNPDPTSIITPHPKLLVDGIEPLFKPQHVGSLTIKGMTSNRPFHPFLRKLKDLGLSEEELDYSLLLKPIESIATSRS